MSNENFEFFLVALPGLEDLVAAELSEWFPALKSRVDHGGVTVWAPMGEGLSMNLALKTPTRVLIRLETFRCRDFPKLYNKVLSLPWKEWIDPTCELDVHVSTRLSRLKIKSRIEEACLDGWMEYRRKLGETAERGKKVGLYVRFNADECTLSLDTSGERLHKRGERVNVGEAPLRETIAAALIQMVGRLEDGKATRSEVDLIDPMMGSGTFLVEAATRDRLVESRAFAFERFAAAKVTVPRLETARPRFVQMVGFEQDAKTAKAAKDNLKSLEASSLELRQEDFFKAAPLPPSPRPRWLFANPPYGERLKVDEPLRGLYERLFAAAERVAQPDRACFILPAKVVKGKFALPPAWKVLVKRPFVNGGIPVVAFVFGRVKTAAGKPT